MYSSAKSKCTFAGPTFPARNALGKQKLYDKKKKWSGTLKPQRVVSRALLLGSSRHFFLCVEHSIASHVVIDDWLWWGGAADFFPSNKTA